MNAQNFQTLPFASGQAIARGILDSLVSTTYFNASALRLIRLWVTGGATIELELALAEGAGLRGGYSTPESLSKRNRFRVEKLALLGSEFRYTPTGNFQGERRVFLSNFEKTHRIFRSFKLILFWSLWAAKTAHNLADLAKKSYFWMQFEPFFQNKWHFKKTTLLKLQNSRVLEKKLIGSKQPCGFWESTFL